MMLAMPSNVQLYDIVTPHDNDVLSGRGNFVNYHTGNERFRALVRKHKVAYVACPKPQKGKFSKMIVDEIRSLHPAGRFLKQDPNSKLWNDIGEKKALDKTRQALREGAPDIVKGLPEKANSSGEEPHPDSAKSTACMVGPSQKHNVATIASPIHSMQPPQQQKQQNLAANNGMMHASAQPMPEESPRSHYTQSGTHPGAYIELQQQQAQHEALQREILQRNTIQHNTIQRETVQRNQALPSGLRLHGTQMNSYGGEYPVVDPLPSKVSNTSQIGNYQGNFDHQPLLKLYGIEKEPYEESETLAPLPSYSPARQKRARSIRKQKPPMREMKRENSDGSLRAESVFPLAGEYQSKMGGSSAHLSHMTMSVMSLSICDEDLLREEDGPIEGQDNLAPLFNNSLRISGDCRTSKSSQVPHKRTGDEPPQHDQSGMDMSTATLGTSDFGDASTLSMNRMSESQANMSFGNVFEEKERELYVSKEVAPEGDLARSIDCYRGTGN